MKNCNLTETKNEITISLCSFVANNAHVACRKMFHMYTFNIFPEKSHFHDSFPLTVTTAACVGDICVMLSMCALVVTRAVPNIPFVFYSVGILGQIVYSCSAK